MREGRRGPGGGSGGGSQPPQSPPPAAAAPSPHAITVDYAGFRIQPTGDGKWVATQRGLNVIPGAMVFHSADEAQYGVDVLLAVSHSLASQRFHHLNMAIMRACGKLR